VGNDGQLLKSAGEIQGYGARGRGVKKNREEAGPFALKSLGSYRGKRIFCVKKKKVSRGREQTLKEGKSEQGSLNTTSSSETVPDYIED